MWSSSVLWSRDEHPRWRTIRGRPSKSAARPIKPLSVTLIRLAPASTPRLLGVTWAIFSLKTAPSCTKDNLAMSSSMIVELRGIEETFRWETHREIPVTILRKRREDLPQWRGNSTLTKMWLGCRHMIMVWLGMGVETVTLSSSCSIQAIQCPNSSTIMETTISATTIRAIVINMAWQRMWDSSRPALVMCKRQLSFNSQARWISLTME